MGFYFLDQYSLLHFSVGVVAYFWSLPLWLWNTIHIIFEVLENTQVGMQLINNFTFWPGGKNFSDGKINQVGDIVSGHIGWLLAYYLDKYGSRYGWFTRHVSV